MAPRFILLGIFLIACLLCLCPSVVAQQEKGVGIRRVLKQIEKDVAQPPKRFAFLVGAGQFEANANSDASDDIPALPQCSNDVQVLKQILLDPSMGMFDATNVMVLDGADATKEAIIDGLDRFSTMVGPEDLAIVYFSGHGAVDSRNRSYWLTHETNIKRLRSTALPESEITDLINELQTSRLVTFIDACYSASTANLPEKDKSLVNMSTLYPEFSGKGRIAITASDGNEKSLVITQQGHPGFGHSVFTYHLAQGLEGAADQNKDGVITVDELWSHVRDRTSTTARQLNGRQTPQLKGKLGSKFLLSVNADVLLGNFAAREKRLKRLYDLALNKQLSAPLYREAKELVSNQDLQLTKQQARRKELFVSLADGKLDISKFKRAMELAGGSPSVVSPSGQPNNNPAMALAQRMSIGIDFQAEDLYRNTILKPDVFWPSVTGSPKKEYLDIFKQVKRVRGGVALPDSLKAVRDNGDRYRIPDFVADVEFADLKPLSDMLKTSSSEFTEIRPGSGEYIFKFEDQLRMKFLKNGKVRFASVRLIDLPEDYPFTKSLEFLLDQMPADRCLRIAFEIEKAKTFFLDVHKTQQEFMAKLKKENPELAAELGQDKPMDFEPILSMKSFSIAIDLAQQNWLEGRVEGNRAQASDDHSAAIREFLRTSLGDLPMSDFDQSQRLSELANSIQVKKSQGQYLASGHNKTNLAALIASMVDLGKSNRQKSEPDFQRFQKVLLGILNHESATRKFPWGRQYGETSDLSWRAGAARMAGEDDSPLYEDFDLKAPWNEGRNRESLDKMPAIFGQGTTTDIVRIVTGKPDEKYSDIKDGLSKTICIIQYPPKVTWLEPKDLTIDQAIELVRSLQDGEFLWAGTYEGAVLKLDNSISESKLRNWFDPNNGK